MKKEDLLEELFEIIALKDGMLHDTFENREKTKDCALLVVRKIIRHIDPLDEKKIEGLEDMYREIASLPI